MNVDLITLYSFTQSLEARKVVGDERVMQDEDFFFY